MICSKCGAVNSDDSMFCMNCGNSMNASQNTGYNATTDANSAVGFNSTENSFAQNNGFGSAPGGADYNYNMNNGNYGENAGNFGANGSFGYDNGFVNQTETKKKKKWLMPVIVGGIAVIAIIVTIVVLVSIFGGRYITKDTAILLLPDDGEILIFVNGEKIESNVSGESYSHQSSNIEGDISVFIADESMYIVDGTDVKKLVDDVNYCTLSAEGEAVLYKDKEGVLYHYDLGNDDKVKISDSAYSYEISPDGDTVVYAEKNDSDSDVTVYMRQGSDKIKIGSGFEYGTEVCAVSDDGDYIYIQAYKNSEYKFSVYLDEGENSVSLAGGQVSYYRFNYDCTQVLYRYDGKTYISDEGGEKVKISTQSLSPSTPANVESSGIKDFFDCAYHTDSALYYVDSNGNDYKLASGVSDSYLTEDGDTFYYLDGDTLYSVEVAANAIPEEILDDVSSFDMSLDGDDIYFKRDGDLYYCSGKNSFEKIKSDVGSYVVTEDGMCMFLCDDELYISDGGGSAESVDDSVTAINAMTNTCIYMKSDDSKRSIYMSDGSDDFELVYEADLSEDN